MISAPAMAQSPYVAGAIGADVSRVSHADSSLFSSPSSGAEVLSGALRVGTSVGPNWGVELEFARSGRTEEQGPIVSPLALAGSISGAIQGTSTLTTITQLLPAGTVPGSIPIPIPFDYQSDVRTRHSSVDAVAWARQSVGGRVDLVYLGGIAFSRDRSDLTEAITPVLRTIAPPETFHSTFIDYATRPLVGMEARIKFTSRLRLIPGFRVQGLADGWLLRPYVGLGWFF
jgi:hypothetical protein